MPVSAFPAPPTRVPARARSMVTRGPRRATGDSATETARSNGLIGQTEREVEGSSRALDRNYPRYLRGDVGKPRGPGAAGARCLQPQGRRRGGGDPASRRRAGADARRSRGRRISGPPGPAAFHGGDGRRLGELPAGRRGVPGCGPGPGVGAGPVVARGRASGVAVDSPAAWLCYVRAGRVTRVRFYSDPAEAIEAAGLE